MNIESINTVLQKIKSPLSQEREGAYNQLRVSFFNSSLSSEDRERLLINLCSQDFLHWGIEEGEGQKTLARSFSLLVLNALIASDQNFDTSKKLASLIINSLEEYLKSETDWRNSSEDLGDIHGAAHFSDLLTGLYWHKSFDDNDVLFLSMLFLEKSNFSKNVNYPNEIRLRIEEAITYLTD